MSPTWPPDFSIERGLVENQETLFAGLERIHLDAVAQQGDDDAFGVLGLVAEEFGRPNLVLDREPDRFGRGFAGAGPGLAGLGALARHRGVECVLVHADFPGAQRLLGQVERESKGVVELEGDVARKILALAKVAGFLFENGEAARERDAEPRLLELQRLFDQGLGAGEFGKSGAHFAHQRRDEPPHQRVARAEHLGVAHGAAHDAAQDIAAAFVRRQDAVGDQEGGGAQMVGDDAMARLHRAVGIDAGGVGDGADQGAEQVDVEIGMDALHQSGDALQAHAGVDRGTRQRNALARRDLLILHEDQIPELQEPVAVLVGAAGRPAA